MKYKEIEQGLTDRASEPVANLQAASTAGAYVADDYPNEDMTDDNLWLNSDVDPGVGPYTMEELYARIEKAEESVRQGKGKLWSQVEAELKAEFP